MRRWVRIHWPLLVLYVWLTILTAAILTGHPGAVNP